MAVSRDADQCWIRVAEQSGLIAFGNVSGHRAGAARPGWVLGTRGGGLADDAGQHRDGLADQGIGEVAVADLQ